MWALFLLSCLRLIVIPESDDSCLIRFKKVSVIFFLSIRHMLDVFIPFFFFSLYLTSTFLSLSPFVAFWVVCLDHEECSCWLVRTNCVHRFQFCIQECHVGNMKLAMVGVFIPWKAANPTNQGFALHPESWLISTSLLRSIF